MYYFMITTLIIYPTAVLAAVLGIVGGTRYRHQRAKIGSFDAAQVFTALQLCTRVVTTAYTQSSALNELVHALDFSVTTLFLFGS